MRLLLDEMLSPAVARQLRDRGLDATAVVEDPTLIGAADEELLVHAAADGSALVTLNISDFAVIAARWRAEGRTHGGLVFVATRAFPQNRAFIGAVTRALAAPDLADTVRVEKEVFLRPAP